MRIVIARSNPVAPDPRVSKTAEALHDAGHEVHIVAWDRSSQFPLQESNRGFDINRLHIHAAYGRGLWNFLPLVRWQGGLLRWLWTQRASIDAIHACDFDTVLPALVLKLFAGKLVVYDIYDFYAEHLRATPSWVKRLIRVVDLWSIGRLDAVILADERRRVQIEGSKPKQLAVVYNTPKDLQASLPGDTSIMRPNSRLHIVFVGLLQRERGLYELLEVVQRNPHWSLDIAGFGADSEGIEARAREIGGVRFFGRIDYIDSLILYDKADVLIATYDPSIPNHRYASPNKLFEAMMLEKPVIVAAGTGMDEIVEEERCGLVITYGDLDQLEQTLKAFEEHPELRAELGAAGRKAYIRAYGWDQQRKILEDLYHQLS